MTIIILLPVFDNIISYNHIPAKILFFNLSGTVRTSDVSITTNVYTHLIKKHLRFLLSAWYSFLSKLEFHLVNFDDKSSIMSLYTELPSRMVPNVSTQNGI